MFYGKQAKRKTAPKHLKNGLVMRFLLWSWWTDLNRRPTDYESVALPTAPHQQIVTDSIYYTTNIWKFQGLFWEQYGNNLQWFIFTFMELL